MRASRARLAALSRSLCGTEVSTERADWAWNSWSASRYRSRQRSAGVVERPAAPGSTASSIQPSRHQGALARSRGHPGEHGLGALGGALRRRRVREPLAYLRQQVQAGVVAADVEQLGERAVQVLAGLGEPDRLDVRADQVLVGQVEPGRGDRSADHLGRAAEVVLVVGVAGGAVGDDQRGLPGPARPAGPLRVVGRGGRDVAQADGAQRVDVHAEFHRRRAVQHRQGRLAELALALLPVGGGTWAVCSLARSPARVRPRPGTGRGRTG